MHKEGRTAAHMLHFRISTNKHPCRTSLPPCPDARYPPLCGNFSLGDETGGDRRRRVRDSRAERPPLPPLQGTAHNLTCRLGIDTVVVDGSTAAPNLELWCCLASSGFVTGTKANKYILHATEIFEQSYHSAGGRGYVNTVSACSSLFRHALSSRSCTVLA